MNPLLFIAVLFLFFFGSCLFDSGSERIIDNYAVGWIDLVKSRSIIETSDRYSASGFVIVDPYVFAVGNNGNFIIAKQHPTNGWEGGYRINTSITNYFIIYMKRKEGKKVIGPLTVAQFNSFRLELGIENISFHMNYPEEP